MYENPGNVHRGIALTKRGKFAAYGFDELHGVGSLEVFDSLDEVADADYDEELVATAASELGQERVVWRDI